MSGYALVCAGVGIRWCALAWYAWECVQVWGAVRVYMCMNRIPNNDHTRLLGLKRFPTTDEIAQPFIFATSLTVRVEKNCYVTKKQ